MLSRGNTKLGPRIWTWSLPVLSTCPGKSAICKEVCYAARGQLMMLNRRGHYVQHFEKSKRRDFVSWMTHQIRDSCIDVMRVHVSGDFYSAAYVRKWIAIASRNRQTQFFAYTRSWNVAACRPQLLRLSRLPNFRLWLSTDGSMPSPPRWKHASTCYLSTCDADQPARKTDLVFRDVVQSVMKKTSNGSLVCPYDNGITTTTCSHCKFCWRPRQADLAFVPLRQLTSPARPTA